MKKKKIYYLLLVLFIGQGTIWAQSPKLSRAKALSDLDTLVTAMKGIHPDLFFTCSETDFQAAVNATWNAFPDSLGIIDFYKYTEPLTSMLGDGHTQLYFPKEEIQQGGYLLFPLTVEIDQNDSTIRVIKNYREGEQTIVCNSRILSINGKEYRTLIEEMLNYCSGERTFFRLSKVNRDFVHFLYMLHPAENYQIICETDGTKQEYSITALPYTKCSYGTAEKKNDTPPYTFRLMEPENIAIMEFNSFVNLEAFKTFADSLFTVLKNKQIPHLIIDLRTNGGGDSDLGDELLQYISPVPFKQFGKEVSRYGDLQKELALQFPGAPRDFSQKPNGMEITEENDEMTSLRENPLRYSGKIYLLTSHTTFSSAGSLAWAFKNFRLGKIIGEETGGMSVCFGNVVIFQLPHSKINSTISFSRMYEYGATENEIHGAMPDYPVPAKKALEFTIKGIKENKL